VQAILEKARNIRCLICDVDGVLNDGRIYFSPDGQQFSVFHSQDGLGLKMLLRAGIEVGVITARESPLPQSRLDELGIRHVYDRQEDKRHAYEKIRQSLQLEHAQMAFIGDDLVDLACIRMAGLGITVPNAVPLMQDHADWQTTKHGGNGAVREVAELLLSAQNKLQSIHEFFL
jgi:3-deoxy-D-manno-octulosonate 8-phosphate phosphatase (KDO 8-P phosphatase)